MWFVVYTARDMASCRLNTLAEFVIFYNRNHLRHFHTLSTDESWAVYNKDEFWEIEWSE